MRLIEHEGSHLFEVGSRRWLATGVFREDHELHFKDLTSDGWMRSRGCRIRFETGWEVSIIWGNMTYSSNRSHPWLFHDEGLPEWTEEPTTVEIMVINSKGEQADQREIVMGWVTEDEITRLLHLLAELPTNATFSYDMIREE
jgi:hypothetical protein